MYLLNALLKVTDYFNDKSNKKSFSKNSLKVVSTAMFSTGETPHVSISILQLNVFTMSCLGQYQTERTDQCQGTLSHDRQLVTDQCPG